ncbi:MAG TPA: SRPBCC family protein [Fimbriimonas sp.]
MPARILETETLIPAELDEVFRFFSDAANLQRITPPSLSFQIATPMPIDMKAGTRIDYRLRLLGVPFRWKTLISVWDPPRRFVDVQEQGPYRIWEHEHRFEPIEGGTRMIDRVRYLAPGGPLEPLVDSLFVSPRVRGIFQYRQHEIRRLFENL